MKKIIITEFAADVNGFCEYCKQNNIEAQEFLAVALQPDAKSACKKHGIQYIDTLPFFDSNAHSRVLDKSHQLTTSIYQKLIFEVDDACKNIFMDTFVFYSRFYINNFLWIIEVIKGIKEAYRDAEMHVYRQPVLGKKGIMPYFAKRDRFVDGLVEKYCKAHNVPVRVIEGPPIEIKNTVDTQHPGIAAVLRKTAGVLFKKKLKKLSQTPTVFITAPSYHLDRVCQDIHGKYPGVRGVTDLRGAVSVKGYIRLNLKLAKQLLTGKAAKQDLAAVPVEMFSAGLHGSGAGEKIQAGYHAFAALCKEQFEYESCSFWEEFDNKVKGDLLETLIRLRMTYNKQRTYLNILKPRLVISAVSTGEYQGWAEAAKSLNIPSLVIPQKGLLLPKNETARIEEKYIGRAQVTDSFANVAAQTPLVAEYLEWAGYKGNVIQTGNLIFARLDEEKRKEKRDAFFKEIGGPKKVIVWAPSMKTRKSRRFYVLESIDELMDAMKEVFEAVAAMKDVHLIFRIHPGDAITQKEILDLLEVPKNVSVSDSGDFEDVLSLADLMISFSSTAVQEALINYIPVLLYDKWGRYNHLDVDGIENGVPGKVAAAYYFKNKDALTRGIRWILAEHTGKGVSRYVFQKEIYLEHEEKFATFIGFVGNCLA
ncbi:MAG: UDP-N-acetyl glucosamine 2-epimerase [bacterium]|nr:UDP-N-acetyl glucosamine 2-epimerase [bacterium]